MDAAALSRDLIIPTFVVVTHVGAETGGEAYTISNEVSGKYFGANASAVGFLEALRETGSYAQARTVAGLPDPVAQTMLAQFMRYGVVVAQGLTNRDMPQASQPLEARAIMIRFDLFDAAGIAARLAGIGRLAFSSGGLIVWSLLGVWAITSVVLRPDKLAYAVAQVPQISLSGMALFAVCFVVLKIVHEMGHALAYQQMCRRDGIAPGPIRMGLSIFAMTPFPYTNVTGAWRLKGRVPRAIIGAGGLYLEFFVVFAATLYWAFTGAGPVQEAVFQVAMFAAVSSLVFNLNPLIKLDGYYIATDLLGLPNLAGRGSQAAVRWLSRALGAQMARADGRALGYWVLSYLYRWVIFAGIFWLAYQVDPRLGSVVFGIVIVMLILRPLTRSLKQARGNGARLTRVVAGLGGIAVLCALSVIPFRDRVLLDGQLSRYETTFVQVPEAAALRLDARGLPVLESLELVHAQQDLYLRRQIVESATRAIAQRPSGAEIARLQTDLAQLDEMRGNLDRRAQSLRVATTPDSVWTPLAARDYADAWVQPGQAALGAVSTPVPAHLVLWLDQRDFETGLLTRAEAAPLLVRLEHEPACEFQAQLTQTETQLVLRDGAVKLRAAITLPIPPCLTEASSGAGVIARKPAEPKSLFQRVKNSVERALQDRLPVETLLE